MSARGKKMVTCESPIAVIDSGVGGISVLKQLWKLMPNERYIYFGDSKNAPYGVRPTEEIKSLTFKSAERFISLGAKELVIACNTATSAAAAELRKKYPDLPIIGLEPALKPAALSGGHPTVIVMATELTLREKKFASLVERFKENAEIIGLPAPGIVELVESSRADSEEMDEYLRKLFSPFDKNKEYCIVLGCTHFPFAKKAIRRVMGDNVKLFDGAEGAARYAKKMLEERNLLCPKEQQGSISFNNSDESHAVLAKKMFESYEV